MENRKRYPNLCNPLYCTGCAACVNTCLKDALTMQAMPDGFLQPVLNKEECIQCCACEKVCPVMNPIPNGNRIKPITYACWNKNEAVRKQSSSGGAFSALAQYVLEQGGYVVGAAYDENMRVSHLMIHSLDELAKLRGSKYVQSYMGDIFRQVKDKLKENSLVLFVGTPCQVAGLKSFLKKDYPNLYCCDFICHGTPSPLLFQKYIEWIEQEKQLKIHSFNFRHKSKGWKDPIRVANDDCFMKGKYDSYYLGFKLDITLRESCYQCSAKGIPRKGDVTIADFWGIGTKYKSEILSGMSKGISLLLSNNKKGDELIELIKPFIYFDRGSFEEALDGNPSMRYSAHRPSVRDTFYADMANLSFEQLRLKYFRMSAKNRLVSVIRENAPKCCLAGMRRFIQIITWIRNGSKTLQE